MKEVLTRKQSFELEVTPPFDFNLSLEKEMGIRKMDDSEISVDIFFKNVLWSGMYVNGRSVGLKVKQKGNLLSLDVFSTSGLSNADENILLENIEYKFGLKEDITPFYKMAEKDETLNRICRSLYGMRKISCSNLFDMLSIAILLQNAPLKRTNQMIISLLNHFGKPISFDNQLIYLWFTPESIDPATVDFLKDKCRLGYRAPYLKSIASSIVQGYDLHSLRFLPTLEAKEKLMELKGIGSYSAEMVLLDMRHYDVFPVDAWSVQLYWNVYFSELMPTSKQDALAKARTHAETWWGDWMGLAWTYIVYGVELGEVHV